MVLHIGINPIVWSNDDLPELGGDIPLSQCLREAALLGYEGIELGGKFPRTFPELKDTLAPHALRLISGWHSLFLLEREVEEEMDAMNPHNVLLSAMDCEVVITCEMTGGVHPDLDMPLSKRPVMDDGQWKVFCARLDALAMRLATEGLKLAYHHHMGTVIQTEAEIDRLMENTFEAVGLLLDTGHLIFAGGDPVEVVKRHAGRIVHVHTKDVRPAILSESLAQDWSFLHAVKAGVFTVPSDGCLDVLALAHALKAGGYENGWVVVEAEQDPAVAPPLRYAGQGYSGLRKALATSGLIQI